MENEIYRKENFSNENLSDVIYPGLNNSQETEGNHSYKSLLNSGEILNESWLLYKTRFKTLLGIVFIPYLAYVLVLILYLVLLLLKDYLLGSFGILIIVILFLILMVVLSYWERAAFIFAIKDSEEKIGIKESYQRGKGKIFQIFLVSFLTFLIVLGGFFILIIPGIIFSVWFLFTVFIVVEERLKGIDALLKSREYVRGYWWKIFWRNMYIAVIFILISIFFGFIEIIFSSLNLPTLEAVITLINTVFYLIFSPIIIIYQYILYKNIKAIKGDFTFKPSKKTKISFIIIPLIGVILFVFFVVSYILNNKDRSVKSRTYDLERKLEIKSLHAPLLLYADDHNDNYPDSLNQLAPKYIDIIPADPETKISYEYKQINNKKGFELCAYLETGERDCISEKGYSVKPSDVSEEISENGYNQNNSNDFKRKTDLKIISNFLEEYRNKKGEYPISKEMSKIDDRNNEITIEIVNETGINFESFPFDSVAGYFYGYTSIDGKSYKLTARLDDINDPQCSSEIKNICIFILKSN